MLYKTYLDILSSLHITLFYSIVSFIIGVMLSMLMTLARLLLNIKFTLLISIIRGTPLIVQLYFFKYCFPIYLLPWQAGLIAFSINSAVHLAEILRGSMDSIDSTQMEASQTLGLSKRQTIFTIIMPQAIRISLPAIINEASALLKETAIISIVGERDIMRAAINIGGADYNFTVPILAAGSIYFILFFILERIALFFSRKMLHNSEHINK